MNIEFEGKKKKKNLGVKYLIFHSLWNVEVQINSNLGGGVREKVSQMVYIILGNLLLLFVLAWTAIT